MKFEKLSRSALRALLPGQSVSENGIVYERTATDGRWSINVMVNGRRVHQAIGFESQGYTRQQAEDRVAQLKASKNEQKHGVAAPRHQKALTIAEAVDDYLKYLREHGGRDLDNKVRRFEQHVVPHLGKLKLHALKEDDWSRYVVKRTGEGAKPATVNRERSALLHLLNTAKRRKIIRDVPMLDRQAEPPGKIVYLTPDQAQRLVEAAENDQSEHALPFVMIALYTGMRHDSVLNLRVRDVDCEQRVLWVADDKAGARQQPMPTVLATFLRKLIARRPADDFLFASPRAKSGRVYQASSIFARCVERAGLGRNITPHTLRHTAATNAAHAGLDSATIQGLGGWKTRAMADRYTHAANLNAAMDALGARLSGRTTPKLHQASRKRR